VTLQTSLEYNLAISQNSTLHQTTNMYIMLRYKWRHVSALIKPSSDQFDLHRPKLCKSNWPNDGSIRAETSHHLYLNKIYVLVVSNGVYYSLNYKAQMDGASQNL
jgi:hypothetical protein